jgi:hypothetical protein
MPHAALEARLILAEVDEEILIEQYRHLQMEYYKARVEFQSTRIKLRHVSEAERNEAQAEKIMAAMEERMEMFDRLVAEMRERIIDLHVEWAELEEAVGAEWEEEGEEGEEWEEGEEGEEGEEAMAPIHKLDGKWIGHEKGSDALIRLMIDGEHARFEAEEEGEWYEGELALEREGEHFWEFKFRIERCPAPQYEGKVSLGLASIQEDRFVLAANEPGNPNRPSSLDRTDETRVFVFERE